MTTSEEIVQEFGYKLSSLVDELFKDFKPQDAIEHDRVLTAMALGAISAATGIIMEMKDEEYARKVMRQSAKIIHKTLEVKRTRDTL